MKILLKSPQTAKLYKGEHQYTAILEFVTSQFNLKPQNYYLTYKDQEGDDISISSTSDLILAKELNQQKSYLKIDVNEQAQTKIPQEVTKTNVESKAESKVEEKIEQNKKEEQSGQRKCHKSWRKHRGQGKSSDSSDQSQGKRKFMKFTKKLNQHLSNKIDDRLKELIPAIKAQMENGNFCKILSCQGRIANAEIQSRSCLETPVTGIRYSCQISFDFNLCENSQEVTEERLNLLKNSIPEEERCDKKVPWFLKMMMGDHHQGHRKWWKRRSGSKQRKERSPCFGEKMFFHKKMKKLAKIYGGEPEQYRAFVEANKQLHIGETMLKYAQVHEDKNEVQKLIDFRAGKLAEWFNKKPEDFFEHVRANLELKPKELFKRLIETGVQKATQRRSRGKWRGYKSPKQEKNVPLVEQKEKKEPSESSQSTPIAALLQKKEKSPGRGRIIQTLINLFGRKDIKEYLKLIEEHGALGQEKIVDLWIERLSNQQA